MSTKTRFILACFFLLLDILLVMGLVLVLTLMNHPMWTIPAFLYTAVAFALGIKKISSLAMMLMIESLSPILARGAVSLMEDESQQTDASNGIDLPFGIDPLQDAYNSRN